MSNNVTTEIGGNRSETNDYKDYCVCSDWDGDGEIFNGDNKVKWRFQSTNADKYSTKLFRSPVFVFRNSDGKELSVIYCKRRLPLAQFVVVEKDLPVCTINQRSVFFTRYEFEFVGGIRWNLYMPMFSVRGKGTSNEGKEIFTGARSRRQWFIRISSSFDSSAMMAALAYITRKKLQRT